MSPQPTIRLRPATAADAAAVAQLLIDTRRRFMPYAPSPHSDDEVRAWVARELLPGGGVTVATTDQAVVAAMAVDASRGGWIHQMAVDPRRVGQGIGSVLLRQALETLPRPVRLYTFQANTGARRFYERHGFVPVRFTDGRKNEEQCPDVLYEHPAP